MQSFYLPERLSRLALDYDPQPITHGRSGARVYRLEAHAREHLFLKIAPPSDAGSLQAEAERLGWLGGKVPVPDVLEFVIDTGGAYLLTSAVPGAALIAFNGATDRTKRQLAEVLGEALGFLHAVDISACPFPYVDLFPSEGTASTRAVDNPSKAAILHDLKLRLPPASANVLLHGDPCLPNILVSNQEFSGLVDLGGAGIGNPYQDLATALWSLKYNFGNGFEEALLGAYREFT